LVKISTKATNERREKVWFLMLKGHNPQSIIKILQSTKTVVYNDINFLTDKSKQYIYDMAKGTHVLMYQRAIEGIGLTLENAWNKFNDPSVPEKQKPAYLRLTKECNESITNLTANGASVLALKNIIERTNRLGIDHKPLALSEQEQIRVYMGKKFIEGSDIGNDNNTNDSESQSE
jgi:hypothetical protein